MYERFDVVAVPFPFTDSRYAKRRPAVVLSSGDTFNRPSGHALMAMITSALHAPWPLDVPVSDLVASGLSRPCVVRMKVFTLDLRFVIGRLGRLSSVDAATVKGHVETLLSG